jgi:hypothetical protein
VRSSFNHQGCAETVFKKRKTKGEKAKIPKNDERRKANKRTCFEKTNDERRKTNHQNWRKKAKKRNERRIFLNFFYNKLINLASRINKRL